MNVVVKPSPQLGLGLSTSTGSAHVCVFELIKTGGIRLLFEFSITEYKEQSAQLLPQLLAQLELHQLRPNDLTFIVADVGPGGFTSLRTACGVAQGLAFALEIPIACVSSLELLLIQARQLGLEGALSPSMSKVLNDAFDHGACVRVFLDAKLGEVYHGDFRVAHNARVGSCEEIRLIAVDRLLRDLESDGNDVWVCDQLSHQALQGWAAGCQTAEVLVVGLSGVALALAGEIYHRQGKLVAAHLCQPMYIRTKVAQTTAERMEHRHG